MAHELTKVSPGSPDEQVEMVPHEHKGRHEHLVYLRRPLQEGDELPSIVIVREDILLCVPPAGNVVNGILVLYPQRAGHEAKVSGRGVFVKNKDLTPTIVFLIRNPLLNGERIAR